MPANVEINPWLEDAKPSVSLSGETEMRALCGILAGTRQSAQALKEKKEGQRPPVTER
jgi:hypothetical protein